jgi:hypothetical protein
MGSAQARRARNCSDNVVDEPRSIHQPPRLSREPPTNSPRSSTHRTNGQSASAPEGLLLSAMCAYSLRELALSAAVSDSVRPRCSRIGPGAIISAPTPSARRRRRAVR